MRALVLVFGLLVVLVGLGLAARATLFSSEPAPGGAAPPADGQAAPATGAPATALPTPGEVGGAVATRAAAGGPPPATDLSDVPTACLEVVDQATGQPVRGAMVRRVRTGGTIGFTDQHGRAPLPLPGIEQLAVCADGYLLRMVPARVGSTEAEPQRVQLVGDMWSHLRRLQFQQPGGAARGDVFVRFHPTAAAAGPAQPLPDDPALQRAWSEHTTLLNLPVCADIASCPASYDAERVLRLRDGAMVSFLVGGRIGVEAATADGFVARTEILVDAAARAGTPLQIQLAPGTAVTGHVRDAVAGEPIAGATVTVAGGDPLGLTATTGADGAFRVGPLLPGEVELHVRLGGYEPVAVKPTAGSCDVRLQPLPGRVLRGRVRSRPDLAPIAGATVAWLPTQGEKVTAVTDAQGAFALRATGSIDARLAVQAEGFQFLSELVAPDAAPETFDLWPARTEDRLAKGLTAAFAGVVLDAGGAPVGAATVRWVPATHTPSAVTPGRRILDGGTIALKQSATTLDDGSFFVETDQFGPGRLLVTGGQANGTAANAVAGEVVEGLRLRR